MSKTTEKKRNGIGNIIGKTEAFFEKNQKVVLGVFSTVLVLVLAGFLIYKFYLVPREAQAAEALFPAQNWYAMDSLDKALNGDGKNGGFIDVADEYGSTKPGNIAKYYAGFCLLKKGKYEDAIEYLKSYKAKNDFITDALCKTAIGDAYLELGKTEEAISYYSSASKIHENDVATPYALMKLGQAYEIKGDFSKATETYKSIKTNFPMSTEARDIDKYIAYSETLGKK